MNQLIRIAILCSCVFAWAACGDEDDESVSGSEAIEVCEAICDRDAECDDATDAAGCKSACGLSEIIASCSNGRKILDHQETCNDLACGERRGCLDESPECSM